MALKPFPPRLETLSVHAGSRPDPQTGAVIPPLYRTAAYVFPDADHAASLFNLEIPGHIYSRISNPTVGVFEERMAALEGGVGAVAVASGQAGLHLVVTTLMGQGGHIVSSSALYGGSVNFFLHTLPRFGIHTTLVKPDDLTGMEQAIRPETRMLFTETIGNPTMTITDLSAWAEVASRSRIPLVIDNTFATPMLCRPFEWGADLVLHSATKYIGGHGTVIGGVVVDGGRFEWAKTDKFPLLTEAHPAYHGVNFSDQFGVGAFAALARADSLRDFGAAMSPDTADALIRGLETLPVRMERHSQNALAVASFLNESDSVSWVSYPGLSHHPQHDLASRILSPGYSGLLAFGVKGGRETGRRFIENLQWFFHLANVGDVRSLVIHPSSTTHAQLTSEELSQAGVSEDMVRMSVGLENPEDLIADLSRALHIAGSR